MLAAALALPLASLFPSTPAEAARAAVAQTHRSPAAQRAQPPRPQASRPASAGRAVAASRSGHVASPGRARAVRRAPQAGTRLRDAPQELLPAPASPATGQVLLADAQLADTQLADTQAGPRAACLAAARRAERVHDLPPGLLVAVALSESGLHAHALSIGGRAHFPADTEAARRLLHGAPARANVMAGCVQVNARVHARGSDWPLDPVRSADWAGGILRRWYQETGNWGEALRLWHGGPPRSAHRLLCRVRAKLDAASPGSSVLADQPCAPVEFARARRNGAALLEVAEMP